MLGDVLDLLECPHCRRALSLHSKMVRCENGHAFDVARQGYVNLLAGATATTGDSSTMVAARSAFLGAGHYQPVVSALRYAARAADRVPGAVVDLGAGTGHHLAAVLDDLPGRVGIAADASKYAARRAARAHPRIGSIACDAWRQLPIREGSAAVVLDVFAPRNGPEIRRVLAPGGVLLVVTPTERHLAELIAALGLLTVDERKARRLDEQLGPYLSPEQATSCEFVMQLSHDEMTALVAMGPSAWHTGRDALRRWIAGLPEPFPVTASISVTRYSR